MCRPVHESGSGTRIGLKTGIEGDCGGSPLSYCINIEKRQVGVLESGLPLLFSLEATHQARSMIVVLTDVHTSRRLNWLRFLIYKKHVLTRVQQLLNMFLV